MSISIIIAIIIVIEDRKKMKRLLKSLDAMIDAAITGTFTESILDESMLSALENKLAKYLSSSELSANNVKIEKEKIKEMIADLSHQTKTPLSNILLYIQLIQEQNLQEEGKGYVTALNEQAEKLSFLMKDFVKVARLETGILVLHPNRCLVMPMLERILQHFDHQAKEKGLEFRLMKKEADAIFDEKWTIEAIGNIVDNAIKYTERGVVTIDIIPYEMFTCVQIKDTGIGIVEEEQPKIFARFYRSPSVAQQSGLGIGLYLARQIIASEGGYIKVSSSCGKGAVFSIYLPK